MHQTRRQAASQVPKVSLSFWVFEVIATILGETEATQSP